MSFFFANRRFYSCIGFEPAKPPLNNIREVNADTFGMQIEKIQKILQDNMLIAQADHEHHANQHCSLAPQYKKRDLIWLDIRNLFIKQPSRKLENCYTEKYHVKKIISNHAVKLDLLNNLYIYPVFHVNLLKPATTDDPYLGYIQFLSPPIEFDEETKYEIIVIIDSRFFERAKKL